MYIITKNITKSIPNTRWSLINHTVPTRRNRRNHQQSLTTSTLTHPSSSCRKNVVHVSDLENVLESDQRTIWKRLPWRIQKTCLTLPHYDAKFKQSHQRCLPRHKTTPLINTKTETKPLRLHQQPWPQINFILLSITTISKLSPSDGNVKNIAKSIKTLRLNALQNGTFLITQDDNRFHIPSRHYFWCASVYGLNGMFPPYITTSLGRIQ